MKNGIYTLLLSAIVTATSAQTNVQLEIHHYLNDAMFAHGVQGTNNLRNTFSTN